MSINSLIMYKPYSFSLNLTNPTEICLLQYNIYHKATQEIWKKVQHF